MVDILQITRGLAAIAVVVWHTLGYRGDLPPIVNTSGRTAVWIFFGISGYVISYGLIHGQYKYRLYSLRHFYTNRLLRICPLFFAISFLAFIRFFTEFHG